VREFARSGADFLVNISNDGWFWGSPEMDQHMAICVFRAVETRLPIARASNTGISSFIEPTGRIQAYLHEGDKYREVAGVLAQPLRMSNLRSPYRHIGEAFSIACVIATAALWIIAFLRPRKTAA
jgi:apolipoprotein N-acyltransferase